VEVVCVEGLGRGELDAHPGESLGSEAIRRTIGGRNVSLHFFIWLGSSHFTPLKMCFSESLLKCAASSPLDPLEL
jgi:hypothetical protein